MIRISDIIKMSNASPQAKRETKPIIKETEKAEIPNAIKASESSKAESLSLYTKGISLLAQTFHKAKNEEDITTAPILEFSKNLVEEALADDGDYLLKLYEGHYEKEYLPYHSVNVGFLAVEIGIWSGFNKSELMELSISGLLHDIGMAKIENMVYKDSKLRNNERNLVKQHPESSMQILKKLGCLSQDGLNAVRSHHFKGSRDKFAEILSLADIYEAITHVRPYKQAKTAHQAIAEIIDKEALNFQPSILKVFVNNIGIYPAGSWVKLSTGEVGLVTGVNKGYPLRPKVSIIFNHSGERNKKVKFLDFMSETYFYIEGPLDIDELEKLKSKWEERNEHLQALN
ncbi:MAG: HD domain-containing protein [Candidatus Omnitrophica bacterium]|nr:HD domain-containing protein [Candidatus Omnitrophota bacterium]